MNENYFMGLDGFVWFIGVVENRNDPAKLGRVQVRCLGFHTEDLTDIPSADLPWAHIMMPVTDPSMQGLGNTPSFLVEGSWVVGFFRDANEKQQPVIMGSLPGNPQNEADITKGFNDLSGNYPSEYRFESGHGLDESDVSRLARDEDAETHLSLVNRRATQFKDIPTATKPNVSTVSTASVAETVGTFDEPTPRGYEPGTTTADVSGNVGSGNPTGEYPFNHVHESESGHIKEIDDTPDGERLYTQHAAGTYEEIIADGIAAIGRGISELGMAPEGVDVPKPTEDIGMSYQQYINMISYSLGRNWDSLEPEIQEGFNYLYEITPAKATICRAVAILSNFDEAEYTAYSKKSTTRNRNRKNFFNSFSKSCFN